VGILRHTERPSADNATEQGKLWQRIKGKNIYLFEDIVFIVCPIAIKENNGSILQKMSNDYPFF